MILLLSVPVKCNFAGIDTKRADRLFSTWQEYEATSPVPSSSSRSRSRLNPPNTQYIRNRILGQLARTHLDYYIICHFGVNQFWRFWRFWRYCVYCHLSWYYTCFKNKTHNLSSQAPEPWGTPHTGWTPPTGSEPVKMGIDDCFFCFLNLLLDLYLHKLKLGWMIGSGAGFKPGAKPSHFLSTDPPPSRWWSCFKVKVHFLFVLRLIFFPFFSSALQVIHKYICVSLTCEQSPPSFWCTPCFP